MNTKIFIIALLSRIWRESNFPSAWELAHILPFAKPGKDSTLAFNYRPIALTSCLCKLMEKMVNVRLVWYLERNGILSAAQCGFRRLHSTTDVLIRLESSICEAFAAKQHHISVFFDLEKAYDTTWRFGILKVLHESGLRGEMPLFIKAFLSSRVFQVRVGSILSERKIQEEGVPQGSVLSVTLFALAINGITEVLPPNVMYSLFVDDFCISYKASSMALAERKLQLSIKHVQEWADLHGFKFSTNKTVAIHFCHIRKFHPDPDLFLQGERIPCVDETRFLGLIFDKKLTWMPHLKSVKLKCQKALEILKVLSHTSWGADRKMLLRLHHSLILSKLLYGCEVFTSATHNRLKILDSIHHAGVRLATGGFKSSPIPSLLVDAGELPLDHYYQSSLIRCWYRLQRVPKSLAHQTAENKDFHLFYQNHPKNPRPFGFRVKLLLSEMNISRNPVCPYKYSVIPVWKLPIVKFCRYFQGVKSNVTDTEMRSIFLCHVEEHNNSSFIFTDGSKSDAGVGFGVHSNDFNHKGALPSVASNFTAELQGILKAIETIATLADPCFTIFSDSKSVLMSLEHYDSRHPIILKILEWLYLIENRGREVKFCWVPAHVGVPGNEMADKLAKEGASNCRPMKCAVPFGDFIPSIKSQIRQSWQFLWDLQDGNKMREITQITLPWKYPALPRREERILCRLRIGHSRLTHGFLMSGDPPPYCEDCLVPLTIRHLLIECPSLEEKRRHHLSGCQDGEGNFLLIKVLGEECNIDNLFNFIEEAGLMNEI